MASELHVHMPASANDSLEREFEAAEQEQALRMKLESIVAVPAADKEIDR